MFFKITITISFALYAFFLNAEENTNKLTKKERKAIQKALQYDSVPYAQVGLANIEDIEDESLITVFGNNFVDHLIFQSGVNQSSRVLKWVVEKYEVNANKMINMAWGSGYYATIAQCHIPSISIMYEAGGNPLLSQSEIFGYNSSAHSENALEVIDGIIEDYKERIESGAEVYLQTAKYMLKQCQKARVVVKKQYDESMSQKMAEESENDRVHDGARDESPEQHIASSSSSSQQAPQ